MFLFGILCPCRGSRHHRSPHLRDPALFHYNCFVYRPQSEQPILAYTQTMSFSTLFYIYHWSLALLRRHICSLCLFFLSDDQVWIIFNVDRKFGALTRIVKIIFLNKFLENYNTYYLLCFSTRLFKRIYDI